MRTVHEVSELTGVSVRTLQYYDKIGLLNPTERTQAGYRLYSEADLERLQHILLFRELEFPLKDIKAIIESPEFDRLRALDQQIELLKLRRQHIDGLIGLAEDMKEKGDRTMDFEPFDTSKMDEYAAQAKESWGTTPAWTEYEQRSKGRTKKQEQAMGEELMALFEPFGRMASQGIAPECPEAAAQAKAIQDFISDHFYTCTDEIFLQLGRSYAGGDFARNINAAAGDGAAEFAAKAIEAFVTSR